VAAERIALTRIFPVIVFHGLGWPAPAMALHLARRWSVASQRAFSCAAGKIGVLCVRPIAHPHRLLDGFEPARLSMKCVFPRTGGRGLPQEDQPVPEEQQALSACRCGNGR
jgi:hypothetical protein